MLGQIFYQKPDMFLYTSPGGREINEDTGLVRELGKHRILALVADGLGGHGGGELASRTVAEMIEEFSAKEKNASAEVVASWISAANERVLSMQTAECEMKTTLVMLLIQGNAALWAHVGDSRLYHFIDGKLSEQTMDHSVSQMAVLSGEITADEIRGHIDRNRLLRAVGRQGELKAEISKEVPLKGHSHSFLLCSDGFWEYVLEEEMERTLQESDRAEQWVMKMVELLRTRVKPGNDNHTAVAVMNC